MKRNENCPLGQLATESFVEKPTNFFGCGRMVICTLRTHISDIPKKSFEDDIPFPKVIGTRSLYR